MELEAGIQLGADALALGLLGHRGHQPLEAGKQPAGPHQRLQLPKHPCRLPAQVEHRFEPLSLGWVERQFPQPQAIEVAKGLAAGALKLAG